MRQLAAILVLLVGGVRSWAMRRLSIALSVAVAAAGVFAAPVGGGSEVTKPAAKVKQAPAKSVRLCKQF